jgi:uncharacterized protein
MERHAAEDVMDEAIWTRLEAQARARAADADPAHDFAHVTRVVQSARAIAIEEGADVDVCAVAALLHELFNHPKGHPEAHLSGEVCAGHAEELLRAEKLPFANAVADAIRTHAFSRGLAPRALEGKSSRTPTASTRSAPSAWRAASRPAPR